MFGSNTTNLYRAGIDLKTAQYLLGHSSIEMTANVYTHLAKEDTAASVIQLERYLSDGSQAGGDFLKSSQRGKFGGSRKKKNPQKPCSF
ncbi:MAG: tyrosine-type recombinase/integrase [Acutalibacter muris]|nr:tyrosine-type recombinase/integrase [Acutalibacter muris]